MTPFPSPCQQDQLAPSSSSPKLQSFAIIKSFGPVIIFLADHFNVSCFPGNLVSVGDEVTHAVLNSAFLWLRGAGLDMKGTRAELSQNSTEKGGLADVWQEAPGRREPKSESFANSDDPGTFGTPQPILS